MLSQAFEEMEECKGDLSTGLAREGQKDAQLAGLRDQMRQLLAVQTGVTASPSPPPPLAWPVA